MVYFYYWEKDEGWYFVEIYLLYKVLCKTFFSYFADFQSKIEESRFWPPSYSAVEKRTKISQNFSDACEVDMQALENMVLDQHLQQQGWSAAIASFEDLYSSLQIRWSHYQKAYQDYISRRDSYIEFLNK